MVNYAFVLLPLYIYPNPLSSWDPLVTAAKAYPSVPFNVVINPENGPRGACPDYSPDTYYRDAIAELNALPNVSLLGYVHTATSSTCGTSGTDICVCSQTQAALQKNITLYQNWPTNNCSTNNVKDIHVDGIFIDEAPGANGSCVAYMQNITTFAKKTLTRGNTVLFNAGTAVNESYWAIPDYINVFENTEAAYDTANIGALDGNGAHARKTTMLIYSHTTNSTIVKRDVQTIQRIQQDAIAGLYISDLNTYTKFPTNFTGFVAEVAAVVASNNAS
ncbi:Hypothetical protein R9X50_00510700 [Acrodontium crateriforme]|uniref:Spherulation-specific family 4 n=1 Tax=Acrodontium crateriforme TaxID=150365 RepID=A0AAQ3RAN1_9PEZI|nr:Hypothetical protein R9X50_00510700 [Acrodontium crateriforme]